MKKPANGKPLRYGTKIRRMRRGQSIFIQGASQDSVKAVASRIGATTGREYITRRNVGGVRVWRLA